MKINFLLNWKIFWLTCIPMFVIVSLQLLGIRPPRLVSPLPEKKDIFESILPKLEKNATTIKLKKQTSFISPSYAASQVESAAAYTVIDLDTGDILAEKNADTQLPIASLTKMMTAVVALDLASPGELFTVSPEASRKIPTKLGVIPGQKMSVEELLNGLLLTSANDAAEVIKNGIDHKYHEPVFIQSMNKKAQLLGLVNSHFSNPQGFDNPQNYSSAKDLVVLAQYAYTTYPLIAEIIKKDYEFLPANENHKQFDLYNWNGLIGVYPNVLGFKIGNTDKAGKTTVVISEREGKKMLVVVLGAPGILERDMWAAQLLDEGFEKTLGLTAVNVTEEQLREKYNTWKYWN